MRKLRLLSLALVVILAAAMIIPVSAVENGTTLPEADYGNAQSILLYDYWEDGATNAKGAQFDGDDPGYIFLKDLGLGDFSVTFSVDTAGTYNIAISMMGWEDDSDKIRATDVSINGGEKVRIERNYFTDPIADRVDDYIYGFTAQLNAGENTVTFSLTEDFDDSAVKTVYIRSVYYQLAADAAADEPAADVAEEPATAAEEPVVIAPAVQTADLAVVAILALGAFAVAKKH